MKSNNVENVNIHVKMNRSHATISRTTNIMATKNAKWYLVNQTTIIEGNTTNPEKNNFQQ